MAQKPMLRADVGTTIKYLWQTTAAGNRLATTIKYLRGAVGIGLGTTLKHGTQCFCVEPELSPCVHKQYSHQNTFPFASAAQNNVPISAPLPKNHVSPSLSLH
jgi:hypothetical protein